MKDRNDGFVCRYLLFGYLDSWGQGPKDPVIAIGCS